MDFGLTELEDFFVAVDDFGSRSGSSDVDKSDVISGEFDCSFSGNGVGGIEHNTVRNCTEHSEIFEGHLRWTIFTNRDTGMRSDELDIHVGDTSHTDVIESSAEESTKGRAEGNLNSMGKEKGDSKSEEGYGKKNNCL